MALDRDNNLHHSDKFENCELQKPVNFTIEFRSFSQNHPTTNEKLHSDAFGQNYSYQKHSTSFCLWFFVRDSITKKKKSLQLENKHFERIRFIKSIIFQEHLITVGVGNGKMFFFFFLNFLPQTRQNFINHAMLLGSQMYSSNAAKKLGCSQKPVSARSYISLDNWQQFLLEKCDFFKKKNPIFFFLKAGIFQFLFDKVSSKIRYSTKTEFKKLRLSRPMCFKRCSWATVIPIFHRFQFTHSWFASLHHQ